MNDPRQPELPYPPIGIPFVASSDTSVAAAASMLPDLGRLEAVVRRHIAMSIDGFTDDELEILSGLSHQTVSARRRTLVLKGVVMDSGRRRKTRSGRKAAIWVIAQNEAEPTLSHPHHPSRPTQTELAIALEDMTRLAGGSSYSKLCSWLSYLSESGEW